MLMFQALFCLAVLMGDGGGGGGGGGLIIQNWINEVRTLVGMYMMIVNTIYFIQHKYQ